MEVVFHFIFELVKIAILSSIYAILILLIFRIISYCKPDSWFDRSTKNKPKFWFLSGFIISLGLFFYMFTYFGDHGLGDSASVPIGHFKVVRQANGVDSYIQTSQGDPLGILNFTFDNNRLYAETQRENSEKKGDYVVWNLQNDSWAFYKTKTDYLIAVEQNNYPPPEQFKEFWYYYKLHWHGWRFWLLP
jgi:hypothetical protein